MGDTRTLTLLRRRITMARSRFALLAVVAVLLGNSVAPAQDTPADLTPPASAAAENGAADSAPVPAPAESPADVERRRKLRLAILTGGLIAVTGIAMVTLTILGGSATRRGLRRKPLIPTPSPAEPMPSERFDDPADDRAQADPDQPRNAPGGPSA